MEIPLPNDIVMGVHWSPVPAGASPRGTPANLDAICALLDESSRPLEVIRPGHLRGENGSVLHTGDSQTGASAWDDERIFVFLHALPSCVRSVVLGVVSHDRPFCSVPGATCHISDYVTEEELLRIELESLGVQNEHCVATLQRTQSGWVMHQRASRMPDLALQKPGCSRSPSMRTP